MRVSLGGFELKDSEKPDMVQHGGGQMLAVNQFPGGNVSIQNFGPTYQDISWSGWFEGIDAMDRMYKIGNLRQAGKPLDFVTEVYTQKVVIVEFHAEHRTNYFIPFTITLKRIIQLTKEAPKDTVDKKPEITAESKIVKNEVSSDSNQTRQYTVKSGDTLSKIAKEVYGNANAWDKIYEANKDTLKQGPNLIYSGQELKIL